MSVVRRSGIFFARVEPNMAPSKSLVVVRGDRRYGRLDSTFACVSHSNATQSYVVLDLEDGRVAGRTVYGRSERGAVEERMRDPAYDTVLVDDRADRTLLPLSTPTGAIAADLSEMRRAKSDTEIRRLRQMEARVRTGLTSGRTTSRPRSCTASQRVTLWSTAGVRSTPPASRWN